MQITITGPKGGGATTLAVEIAKFLEEKGMVVTFYGNAKHHDTRRNLMRSQVPKFLKASRVVIVDGIEPEDETDVALRPDNAPFVKVRKRNAGFWRRFMNLFHRRRSCGRRRTPAVRRVLGQMP